MYFQALDEMRRIVHPYNTLYVEEVMQWRHSFVGDYQFYAILKNQMIGKGEVAPVLFGDLLMNGY